MIDFHSLYAERSLGFAIICTLGVLALVFGLWCLRAWLVMVLWNWVAVTLFNAPTLTFWLSFAICWLTHLLFGKVIKKGD